MKEEKLFEIVNNVDDDLICEMLEYSPDTEKKGEEYEGALYSAPEKTKKIHYWQYPVTAAALMLVLVGVLFIFNSRNTLPYDGGEQTDTAQETTTSTSAAESEITTTDDPGTPVDTNIPYEFTKEDKELQKFLAETADEAMKYQGLINSGGYFGDIGYAAEGDQEHERIINARFPQMKEPLDKQITYNYMLLSDEMPFKTREELEACLKQYYSAEIVSQFMGYVDIGEVTENTEEYSLIELTEGGRFDEDGFLLACPYFVELNGRLYSLGAAKGGWFTPNWSMAKVISKTDEELIFSFLGYGMDDIKEIRAGLGRLKYEDGWKYDWWDIANPYEMVEFDEVWGTGKNTVESSPLDLLHCRLCEDGHYRVDEDVLVVDNNYDLFRQYFFGTWEDEQGWGSIDDKPLVVDDSMKCYNITCQLNNWCSGEFYKIGDSTLAFVVGGSGGPLLHWLDMNEPETLYYAYGGVGENNWLWPPEDAGAPIVSSLKKSDIPPNEPEENFLSIFKLREISRDYGIRFDLLVDMEYNFQEDGLNYTLAHNANALFYPVYLVSQSPDELEFKTTIGNGYDTELDRELSYTIKQDKGIWTRYASADITTFGVYDSSTLADFDYSDILAGISARNTDDTGNFLDDGYSEFKELYRKAYALTSILVSSPDNFPNAAGLEFKWEDAVRIQVADAHAPLGYRTYYSTGYSWKSFYNEMLSVFTKEQADELIFGNDLFYKFNDGLWYSHAASGGDMTRVHTEYAVEKTEDILDIIRTTYHVELGENPEFDPAKIDEYETKETHFTFIRLKDGSWRASEFADIR